MALVSRKVLFESKSAFQSYAKRFRGKINIQRPRAPHHERAKFLELAKPFYPKKAHFVCDKNINLWKKDEIENPYQRILANELNDYFNKSRLIVFYHLNPMKAEDKFKAYILFKKQNMLLINYGLKTMEMAIKGTKYEAVLEIYASHNMILFSPEANIQPVLAITKKFPQLILLAAIFEGRFISKDELLQYSQIPDLKAAQSGFIHTLNSIGGNVVNQLTSHQNNLVNHLQERIKQLEENEK